jgi:hypothetical protein
MRCSRDARPPMRVARLSNLDEHAAFMHLGKTRSATKTRKQVTPSKEIEPLTASEIDLAEFLPRYRGRGDLLRSCATSLMVSGQAARMEIMR